MKPDTRIEKTIIADTDSPMGRMIWRLMHTADAWDRERLARIGGDGRIAVLTSILAGVGRTLTGHGEAAIRDMDGEQFVLLAALLAKHEVRIASGTRTKPYSYRELQSMLGINRQPLTRRRRDLCKLPGVRRLVDGVRGDRRGINPDALTKPDAPDPLAV